MVDYFLFNLIPGVIIVPQLLGKDCFKEYFKIKVKLYNSTATREGN